MVYSVQDESRTPMMVQNQNPESGMGHARAVIPSISEARRKYCEELWSQFDGVTDYMLGSCQQEGQGTGESAHGIDVPGFDSEVHRKFMRSLG